ncbi:MAG: hypothetical protein R6W90_09900 [Ignavibacteriaceae bacterium]
MKKILMVISAIGLLLTLLPSVLVFTKTIEWEMHVNLMSIGTALWFLTAPFWMKKEKQA